MTDTADDVDDAPVGESTLPAGLSPVWPAPRVGAYGTRDGALARIQAWSALAAMDGLSRLPAPLQRAAVSSLAHLGRAFDRRHTDAAREFVQQALDTDRAATERFVLDGWKNLFRITLDTAGYLRHVSPARVHEHFEVALCADADRIRREKRGAIVVTAHVGDWEAGSACLPWVGFDPFYAIAKPPKNRALSVRLQALREARGVRTLPRRGAMEHAPKVLRAGGTLAMLLDQRARKRPVVAPFFGRAANCDRSAAVLVKRCSAPVMFVACYRKPERWRWKLVCERVLWPEECRELSTEELVGVVNRELEQMILRAPEQYLWLHDRYRGASVAVEPATVP